MLTGYARVLKTDGSQPVDLHRDALQAAGVDAVDLYHDFAFQSACAPCGRATCSLSKKLGQLGRSLAHLVNTASGGGTRSSLDYSVAPRMVPT